MAFMDVYPWSPGHVLVIPKMHAQRVGELERPTRERLFGITTAIAEAVRACGLGCDDVHFLLNDGPAANQTVPHVHMHILPRRRGDLGVRMLRLLQRPMVALFGMAARDTLDRQAVRIRTFLGPIDDST